MFKEMLDSLNAEVIELIYKAQLVRQTPYDMQARRRHQRMVASHQSADGMGFSGRSSSAPQQQQAGKRKPVVVEDKVGRNDPCPCGSGKKYKKCHGKAMA